MATSKDFLTYLTEQTKTIEGITFRPMMGEYLLYYKGKLLGDICDNRVLLKPIDATKALMPDAEMQPPYKGAKPMLVLENLEDGNFIKELFDAMYAQLPEPKPKKRKTAE